MLGGRGPAARTTAACSTTVAASREVLPRPRRLSPRRERGCVFTLVAYTLSRLLPLPHTSKLHCSKHCDRYQMLQLLRTAALRRQNVPHINPNRGIRWSFRRLSGPKRYHPKICALAPVLQLGRVRAAPDLDASPNFPDLSRSTSSTNRLGASSLLPSDIWLFSCG